MKEPEPMTIRDRGSHIADLKNKLLEAEKLHSQARQDECAAGNRVRQLKAQLAKEVAAFVDDCLPPRDRESWLQETCDEIEPLSETRNLK